MYYPLSKIKANQYTQGNEYVILSDSSNYVGYYFSTFDGKYFTGKTIGDTLNLELIKKTTNSPLFSNNYFVVGDKYYTNVLKDKDQTIKNITNYQIPPSSQVIPSEQDYKNGYMMRYFIQRVNGGNIQEVNQKTYNDINKGEKYNKSMFNIIQFSWKITGPLNTYKKDGIFINGVKNINYDMLKKVEQTFPNITKFLTDLTEFWHA